MLFISYLSNTSFLVFILKILTTDVQSTITPFTGLDVKVINTGERERVCVRVCVRARVLVIKNVNCTDQDGNTETSITFLILIQRGMQM